MSAAVSLPCLVTDETEIPFVDLGPYLSRDPFTAICAAGVKSGLGQNLTRTISDTSFCSAPFPDLHAWSRRRR